MTTLDGKVALITGAASGIGLAAAQLFAREGAQVAMADRDADGVNDAARAIGPSAMAVSADVTSEGDVEAMVAACIERFGRLDVAFNNAGIAGVAPIQDFPLERFQQIVDVCMTGVFLCIKHEAKQLIAQGEGGFPDQHGEHQCHTGDGRPGGVLRGQGRRRDADQGLGA